MNNRKLRRKRTFRFALFILLLTLVGMTKGYAQPTGAINGLFSIAEGRQVYFSRGNLQYRASSNTWRFATNQYDIVGSDNVNISPTYSGWIDLFGWGTSGNNHGAVCYQPWSTSTNSTDYYAYGDISYNLNDQTGQADWGFNPISNGGNTTNEWRTLSLLDLYYITSQRNTSSGILYAKAKVANVKGLILLPDNWDASCFYLSNVNQYAASCNSNVISASQWITLENAGAVFLPVGGFRIGNVYHEYNDDYYFYGGRYWLSTRENNKVCDFLIHEQLLYFYTGSGHEGYFVRLINDTGPSSLTINATASPSSGGVVTGSGVYAFNATCTLTATANPGYHFVRWKKNGSSVSSSSTYTFPVRENADYVAVFAENQSYSITVSANPSAGGTVSGGGTYYYGDVCTVYAVANSGYTFESWTRNGDRVSTAASYSFEVTEARNLVANFTSTSGNGMLNGVFSVGNNSTVVFSKGNLQYQASTNVWRFATHQYDVIGNENSNASSDYTGWIDIFAWGTSGYPHGAVCYHPWNTSGYNSDFYAYGSLSYNLGDQTGQADWGYNAICNGGNAVNMWRTLTSEEWEYLFKYRTTNSGIRFVKAMVNGVSGIVLLPDNWNASTYNLIGINGYEVNTISESDWSNILEVNGAVFLPDMPHRLGTEINPHLTWYSTYGKYWSATHYGDEADLLYYTNDGYSPSCGSAPRGVAFGVRLVRGSGSTSYIINATSNPSNGGTVSGAGTYEQGQTCTLTATPNIGYSFVRWRKNGSQVSTNPTYSFTVTGNATCVAEFEQSSVTHSQTLTNGWNWWSSYVELNGAEGLTQLENSLGSAGLMIKSRSDGYVESYQYNGTTGWFGSLTSISNEQMYKIDMSAGYNAAVTGYLTNLSNHPITINSGWNWIGFPLNQSVGVTEALSSFSPTIDDILKGRNGYTTYYSYNGTTGWFGSLNTLEPGCGYMYQSQSSGTKTLLFQSGRGEATMPNITSENNINQPMDQRFADNMTVTAVVEIEGEELRSESHELAAFVDGECRGSVRLIYVEPIDRYLAFLTVFGESGDALEFRLSDGTETLASADGLAYDSDGMVGTLASPKVLHFSTLGVGETSAMVRIYPNPVRTKGTLNIALPDTTERLTVEISNVLGVTVFRGEVAAEPSSVVRITLSETVLPGTYVLKATAHDGTVYYGKLVVE